MCLCNTQQQQQLLRLALYVVNDLHNNKFKFHDVINKFFNNISNPRSNYLSYECTYGVQHLARDSYFLIFSSSKGYRLIISSKEIHSPSSVRRCNTPSILVEAKTNLLDLANGNHSLNKEISTFSS